METYPYPTSEGIIDLVRKSEFDRIKWRLEEQKTKYTADVAELNQRLTTQQADMLDTIVKLRADLTRWQAMAGQLAEAISEAPYDEPLAEALAAYESATKGELPDPLAEVVKRMEAVEMDELDEIWFERTGLEWIFDDAMERIRARLIQAVKGEQP